MQNRAPAFVALSLEHPRKVEWLLFPYHIQKSHGRAVVSMRCIRLRLLQMDHSMGFYYQEYESIWFSCIRMNASSEWLCILLTMKGGLLK